MSSDTRPAPHLRLHEFDVKHLLRVLANCKGGSIGFDPHRNEQTNSKDKLIAYLLGEFTTEQIDEAHAEAVKGYKGKPRRGRRSRQQASTTELATATVAIDAGTQGAVIEAEAIEVDAIDVDETVAAIEAETKGTKQQTEAETAKQLADLLSKLTKPTFDVEQVAKIIDDRVKAAVEQMAVRHVIEVPTLDPIEVGTQHKNFSMLLKACNARLRDGSRLNIWLAGPAGSGKTTAARSVSQALSLSFYFNGAIDQPYKLTGFVDANGNYQSTAFRQAWEHGGVYLFDEVDASAPAAVLEFNAALANGLAAFPDQAEPIERHPDCVIIAGANTTGKGGTAEYVGRMRQDAAFIDRFVTIDWPIDEQLERALCGNVDWTSRVQQVRQNVASSSLKGHMISPRATLYGEALLAAGLSQKDTEAMTLRKGINDADWRAIRSA